MFWKALSEWYNKVSKIPATVKTPPIIAQMFVAKCPIDLKQKFVIDLIKNIKIYYATSRFTSFITSLFLCILPLGEKVHN